MNILTVDISAMKESLAQLRAVGVTTVDIEIVTSLVNALEIINTELERTVEGLQRKYDALEASVSYYRAKR